MKADKASSASASGPTSTTGPAAAKTNLTEAQFLAQEATDAKAAMFRAIGDLKSQVAAGVDPRGWVQDHPWVTLSGVAAASFVATTITVPSKEQQALRHLAAIEAAVHHEPPEKSSRTNGHSDGKEPRSLLAMVALELLAVFKPFLSELLANLVRPSPKPEDPTTGPR
jgi:hypothetical protein